MIPDAGENKHEERWDDEGIGDPDSIGDPDPTITISPDAPSTLKPSAELDSSPSPPTSPQPHHIPISQSSPSKTGWDAIKADVKTPDGLRGVAGLGLGGYLQSLGGGFGLIAGGGGGGGGSGRS